MINWLKKHWEVISYLIFGVLTTLLNILLYALFNRLFGAPIGGRVYAAVQNVFTITKYKGLDPEVEKGLDNNIYPRPLTTLIGLSLNF